MSQPASMAGGRGGRGDQQPRYRANASNFTPPSPHHRKPWMKLGGRARSVENMAPLAAVQTHVPPSPLTMNRSPPISLATGSPGFPDNNRRVDISDSQAIPASPMDRTPPKKAWEHNFRSWLGRSHQSSPSSSSSLPAAPFMTPLHNQQHQQQQQPQQTRQQAHGRRDHSVSNNSTNNQNGTSTGNGDEDNLDHSVRGGKFFQSIFGGSSHTAKPRRRKTKSLNELDEPMRNGQQTNYSPANAARYRKVYSHANVGTIPPPSTPTSTTSAPSYYYEDDGEEDDLNKTLRRATYAGTSTGAAIVPPPMHQPHHILQQQEPNQYHHHQLPHAPQQHYNSFSMSTDYIPYDSVQAHSHSQMNGMNRHHQQPFPYIPQSIRHQQQQPQQQLPNSSLGPPPSGLHSPAPSGSSPPSQYSMSPSSATTEIKKAFTEFHNSTQYARDSTSAYLGDEPSTRNGDMSAVAGAMNRCSMYNPGFGLQPALARNYSGATGCGISHRLLSSSLPTVDENVSIHKSMRMLRPFQTVDCWQAGRRYLIGPAALAACPLLQGLSTISLSSANHTRGTEQDIETQKKLEEKEDVPPFDYEAAEEKDSATIRSNSDNYVASPAKLPPLFGCIVLGKALLSYVIQEPTQHQQQRWWSSCILILRQNYLLEYDQQTGDVLQGLPRGYAHLQYARSYPHADFVDALELEFFVSPCAKADKRVLTIRLEETREKRNNWIACINRAAQLGIKDLYEYDESNAVGRGRYAGVYPARRRAPTGKGEPFQSTGAEQQNVEADKKKSLSSQVLQQVPLSDYDCALKIIDKKDFWRRVVKGRERADTLVREASVQATMASRCSKIPAFVRIRGFFETSDHVVLELELLKGVDLFQYVSSKGVLPEKEAALILRDILLVLDGMNRVGLAHRDVKPANILMVTEDKSIPWEEAPCVVKVADFGMATFQGVDSLIRGRCGTPGYVAPEIFSAGVHGGYGNKVDVFSSGVTLYVMLCGYEPFYGESDAELVAANKEAKLEFPESDWDRVSSEAKNLVRSMMEPDPSRRLSAREALQHPWIVQYAGQIDSAKAVGQTGLEALGHSQHNKGGSCLIS